MGQAPIYGFYAQELLLLRNVAHSQNKEWVRAQSLRALRPGIRMAKEMDQELGRC